MTTAMILVKVKKGITKVSEGTDVLQKTTSNSINNEQRINDK